MPWGSPPKIGIAVGIGVAIWSFFFGDRNLYLESDPLNPYLTLGGSVMLWLSLIAGGIAGLTAWLVTEITLVAWGRFTRDRRA